MPEHPFNELRGQLLESGVAPGHVRRIVAELSDHLEDLQGEALRNGYTEAEATDFASHRLGDQGKIAERILETTEFKSWIYRYPRVARVYLPFAYALILPATPVIAGFANPGRMIRWGTALMLSAAVTAAMFLSMQLAIALT